MIDSSIRQCHLLNQGHQVERRTEERQWLTGGPAMVAGCYGAYKNRGTSMLCGTFKGSNSEDSILCRLMTM